MVAPGILRYKKGFKYWTDEDFILPLPFKPRSDVKTPFIHFYRTGEIIIKAGYAWDGVSGPTWDSKSTRRGSLVHDALYQLIRLGFLEPSYRPAADLLFRNLCLEDGMWPWRARLWYWVVRKFARFAARPSAEPIVLTAP